MTDFGIARAANSNTIHSDVMGSVHYTSPEQARNGFVDGKSDIYSLGIVMYEMVTGRVPFDGESTVAVAIQHLQEEMVVPSAYAPSLPVSIEKIILKCTQKSPDRRYNSISDLLMDLKKALISPDEDFVVMVPLGQQDKTRVMKPDEVESIKEQTRSIYYQDEEEEEDEEEPEEEEDDEGFLNPKMEKAVTIMGIVAAVIIVMIIVYIGGSFMGLFKFGDRKKEEEKKPVENETQQEEESEKVEMIDLKGYTYDEAMEELKKIQLGIEKGGEESSEEYPEGQIVSQSEEQGAMVDKNTTIRVIISSGVGEFDVPDVKGKSKSEAESTLRSAGLVPVFDYQFDDSIPNDQVISQNPDAGGKAKKGDTVTVMLSKGRETFQVPDVRNKPEAEAREELKAAGIEVVSTSSDYADDIPEGNVISQSLTPGKTVEKGTQITLVISLGKKITTTYYSLNNYSIELPNFIPDNASRVEARITLYKSEGEDVISSWKATSFPYTVNVSNIENCSQGYFVIDWKWTYLDEDDAEITEEDQTTKDGIAFTQN